MVTRFAVLFLSLIVASQTAGDTLSDVRAALRRLPSAESVRGTLTIDDVVASSGKFGNDNTKRTATAEVAHDDRGVTITVPPALVDSLAKDEDAGDSIGSIRTTAVIEALTQRDVLLKMLDNAAVIAEKRGTFNARPARLLVLQLKPRKPRHSISVGSVKSDDRLSLWLGDDLIPVAGERDQTTTAGFLFLHGTFASHTKYAFARAHDRLVLARMEVSEGGSGAGQKVDRKSVQTLTMH